MNALLQISQWTDFRTVPYFMKTQLASSNRGLSQIFSRAFFLLFIFWLWAQIVIFIINEVFSIIPETHNIDLERL